MKLVRRSKPALSVPLPALPPAGAAHDGAVLAQLEQQAIALHDLQRLVGELAVERRGEQEALAAVAHEFGRLHEQGLALRREHEDATEAEAVTRAELVAAGATVIALRDQLLAARAELHRARAEQLVTEGELAAVRGELAKLNRRLARANARLRRAEGERSAAGDRWWRRRAARTS